MKHKTSLILVLCLALCATTFAQREKMDEDEKAEKRDARASRINDKTDYHLFHRQMLSLKEYSDERRKIPGLQKANKMPVKVTAVVDTTIDGDDDAGNKTLTGYITQTIGDNPPDNVYEITFSRTQKKIVSVKYTGESNDLEKEEKTGPKNSSPSKTIHKKNKDDDDDDDPDDDAPAKKDKDDDKD